MATSRTWRRTFASRTCTWGSASSATTCGRRASTASPATSEGVVSDPGIGRRFFLRILGATGVAAGCSPAHAPEKLIPLLVPPQNMVPGKALFYRSACRECSAGCGVTARAREGRVVKLEGNPEEPISGGALCARGQAAVQQLYAPDRFRAPMLRGPDGRLAPV